MSDKTDSKDKPKVDLGLLEEDDEFEEFPAEDWTGKEEDTEDKNVWEDNWDDDNVEDDFSQQLRQLKSLNPGAQRLLAVHGYDQRLNDIIRVSAKTTETSSKMTVVFFGGDVQDYAENMESHRDHGKYVRWNLESVAELLSVKFPASDIAVIRPSRVELKTFSCYDNFVHSNSVGAPEYSSNNGALLHLEALLKSLRLDDSCLTLIGFSKGSVVLNQLLYEFHYYTTFAKNVQIPSVIGNVTRMIWLDGGHCGGRDTWITSKSILSSLAKAGIQVEIHVTPYQVRDDRRPWVGQEEKQFYSILKKMNVDVVRKLHFDDVNTPSLDIHFQVLDVFM